MEMTKASLLQVCKEHELYRTPELNDKLYCNFKGFREITPALGAYCNLKALFLEGNALESLHGLPALPQLRCLFLQQNLLTDLSGLSSLPELDTLNLSDNRITCLTHLKAAPKLTTLIATGNLMQTRHDVEGLRECPSLLTIDLQNNQLDDVAAVDFLEELKELRCLYLKGNDVVSKIRNYRKDLVSRFKELTYLDDRPVFEPERRLTEAWARGGVEAERLERVRIQEEERERDRRNFEHLQDIRRAGWRKRREALGLPPGDTDPFFDTIKTDHSSDSTSEAEDTETTVVQGVSDDWTPLSAQDDGVIYLNSIKENEKAMRSDRTPSPDPIAAATLCAIVRGAERTILLRKYTTDCSGNIQQIAINDGAHLELPLSLTCGY